MLKDTPQRKGKWTHLPKKNRAAAHRTTCACCGKNYGYLTLVGKDAQGRVYAVLLHEHIDHTFPRRWIEANFPNVDPHQDANLLSICNLCHGKKKIAEDALCRGDAYEFLKLLKDLKYPPSKVCNMVQVLNILELQGWSDFLVSAQKATAEFLDLTNGVVN